MRPAGRPRPPGDGSGTGSRFDGVNPRLTAPTGAVMTSVGGGPASGAAAGMAGAASEAHSPKSVPPPHSLPLQPPTRAAARLPIRTVERLFMPLLDIRKRATRRHGAIPRRSV